jgi:hypothetical protein
MAQLIAIQCPFCGGETRPRKVDELAFAVGLYVTHLVESHWHSLEMGRQLVGERNEGHDGWKRL